MVDYPKVAQRYQIGRKCAACPPLLRSVFEIPGRKICDAFGWMFGDLCQDVCEPGLRIGLRQRVPEGAAAENTRRTRLTSASLLSSEIHRRTVADDFGFGGKCLRYRSAVPAGHKTQRRLTQAVAILAAGEPVY